MELQISYVSTVGANKKVIEEYIRNQLKEDMIADGISMKEYKDPFEDKDEPNKSFKD